MERKTSHSPVRRYSMYFFGVIITGGLRQTQKLKSYPAYIASCIDHKWRLFELNIIIVTVFSLY